jgi:hypothetical protein
VERAKIHPHEIIVSIRNIYSDRPKTKDLPMAHDLEPYENITRVFWIKIELKENQLKGKQVIGDIKDVISGERSRIVDLYDIITFIIPYMKRMGFHINWFWQLMSWLRTIRRA